MRMDDLPALSSLLDLTGKVALVTGAGQGFGFACASGLADAGGGGGVLGRPGWRAGGVRRAGARAPAARPARAADRRDAAPGRHAGAGRNVAAVDGDVSREAVVARLVG